MSKKQVVIGLFLSWPLAWQVEVLQKRVKRETRRFLPAAYREIVHARVTARMGPRHWNGVERARYLSLAQQAAREDKRELFNAVAAYLIWGDRLANARG